MSNKIFIYFLIVFEYPLKRVQRFNQEFEMKKIFITMLLASFIHTYTANAANIYRPYIGADLSFNKAKTNLARPDYLGAILNLGTTYNTYFGTEIFYQQTASRAKTSAANQKYTTSFRGYGLDGIITAPASSKFDVNVSFGIATYVFKEKLSGTHRLSDEGIGFRFGAGAVYHFTNRIAARLSARYIKFNDISNLKHASEYLLGIRYYLKEN